MNLKNLAIYLLTGTLFNLIVICIPFGYSPEDQCANDIKDSLSPYQTARLTEYPEMPVPYQHIKEFCVGLETDHIELIKKTAGRIHPFGSLNEPEGYEY